MEESVIGLKSGATEVPVNMAELKEFVAAMRPRLAVNEQTRGFLDFLISAPTAPARLRPVGRALQTYNLHAALRLMPPWARAIAGFRHPEMLDRLLIDPRSRMDTRLLRWAFGTPPFRAMAEARAAGRTWTPQSPEMAASQ